MGHVKEGRDKQPGMSHTTAEGDEVRIGLDTPDGVGMMRLEKSKQRRKVWAVVDRATLVHSMKVGLAVVLASLLVLVEPVYEWIGYNAVWAVISVIVMYEPTLGGVLSKGFNRGMGTILAGLLALGAGRVATVAGPSGEGIVIALMLFLAGTVVTYLRSLPKLKSQYDYGLVVACLTFCFLLVLGYRLRDDTRVAGLRVLTVVIAFLIVLLLSTIWPRLAGSELRDGICDNFGKLACAVEMCVAEYVKGARHMAVPMIWSGQIGDDPVHQSYRDIVLSKSLEDSLLQLTNWETVHWPFKHYIPWSEFADVSKNLRRCAYAVIAMDGCLRSEIQAPTILRQLLASDLLLVSMETARVAFLLSASVRLRCQVHASELLQGIDHAAQSLQRSVRDIAPMLVLRSRSLSEDRDGFMMVDGDDGSLALRKGDQAGGAAEGMMDCAADTTVAGTPPTGFMGHATTPLVLASWTNYSPSPRSSSENDRNTFRNTLLGGPRNSAMGMGMGGLFGRMLSSSDREAESVRMGSTTPKTPAYTPTISTSWGRTFSVPSSRDSPNDGGQPAGAMPTARVHSENSHGGTALALPGEGRSQAPDVRSPVPSHMMYDTSSQWPELTLEEYEALVAANGGDTPSCAGGLRRGWSEPPGGTISRDLPSSSAQDRNIPTGVGGMYEATGSGGAGAGAGARETTMSTTPPNTTPQRSTGRLLSPFTPHHQSSNSIGAEPSPGLPPLPPPHAAAGLPPPLTPMPTPTRPPLAPRALAHALCDDKKRAGTGTGTTSGTGAGQAAGVATTAGGGSAGGVHESGDRPNLGDLRPSSYLVSSGKRFASGGLTEGGEEDPGEKRRGRDKGIGSRGGAADVRFFSGPQRRKPGSSGRLFQRARSPWSSSSLKDWLGFGPSVRTTEVVAEESDCQSSRGASSKPATSAQFDSTNAPPLRNRLNLVHRISLSDLPGLSREYESIAALSLVTFASLLVESVARVEALVQAVEIFGEKAKFKKIDISELEQNAVVEREKAHRRRQRL